MNYYKYKEQKLDEIIINFISIEENYQELSANKIYNEKKFEEEVIKNLASNLISFNVGVELGQLMALCIILLFMTMWRKTPYFFKTAYQGNVFLMFLGFLLVGYQLTGFITQ